MNEKRYSQFLANPSYQFSITIIRDLSHFLELKQPINEQLKKKHAEFEEADKNRKRNDLGQDSKIADWRDVGDKVYNEGTFKYFTAAAEEEESADLEELDLEQEERELLGGSLEEHSEQEGEEEQMENELGKRDAGERSPELREALTYAQFSQLFDFFAQPAVVSIVRTTADYCDLDFKFLDLLDAFEDF